MGVSANPFRKALATNSTSNAYTQLIPTLTEPTGTGVFKLTDITYGVGVNGRVCDRVLLVPYGGNDDDENFTMRLWGWSKIELAAVGSTLYIPQLLVEFTATLEAAISGAAIGTGMLMADTIAIVGTSGGAGTGDRSLGVSFISPADGLGIATALVHTLGCEYIQFDFDLGTCDAMNCLWRGVADLP